MKKSEIIMYFIAVILILAGIIVFCYAYVDIPEKKSIKNTSKTKLINKKQNSTVLYIGSTNDTKIYLHLKNNKYTLSYKDNVYKTIKGSYTIDDNNKINFDKNINAVIHSNYIEIKDLNIMTNENNIYKNLILFKENKFKAIYKSIETKVLTKYITTNNESEIDSTPKLIDIKTNINNCFKLSNEEDNIIICSVNKKLYINDYNKEDCLNNKYNMYIENTNNCELNDVYENTYYGINISTGEIVSNYNDI